MKIITTYFVQFCVARPGPKHREA